MRLGSSRRLGGAACGLRSHPREDAPRSCRAVLPRNRRGTFRRMRPPFVLSMRSCVPLLAALACASCGPSPELLSPDNVSTYRYTEVTEENAVYVAPPPPEASENPFALTRTWVGEYDCPQGLTDMRLKVVGVRGERVDAIYEFRHAPTGAAGSYHISGRFDFRSGRVSFSPGAWIERPPNYVTVGMDGRIEGNGARFEGRITHPRCGMFSLRASR